MRSLVLAMCALAGCLAGPTGPDAGHSTARRYTTRAEVVALPAGPRSPAQLTVRHEAIPAFEDRSGAAVGMPAMVMSFDLAPGVSPAGLRTGDKVEVVVSVDWARPVVQLEELRKLPPETVLDFGEAGRER